MRVKLILVILVLAATAFFFLRLRPGPAVTEEVAAPESATKQEITTPKARERALYASPRAAVEVAQIKKEELKPECVAFWDKLRGLDLEKTFIAPSADPFPAVGACQTVPKELAAQHKQFQQYCAGMEQLKKLPRAQADIPLAQCQAMALLYRAQIADWLTREVPIQNITDTKVLADKLLAKFATDPAAAAQIAETLLDKNPDLGFAAKAAAITRFMDAQATATGKPNDEKWHKVDDGIARLDKLKDGDKNQTDEIKMLMAERREPDPKTLLTESSRLAESDPKSWVGPYYAARAEHRLGNKDKAAEWMAQCLANVPGDVRCQAGKDNLAKGAADPFPSQLNFDLDPLRK